MDTRHIDIPNVHCWQPRLGASGETVTGLGELAQAIDLLFATLPGEVPLLPGYGFDWLRYTDRPMNLTLRRMERDMVMALRRWEPRIDVAALRAEPLEGAEGTTLVCVTWSPKGGHETVIQLLGIGSAA